MQSTNRNVDPSKPLRNRLQECYAQNLINGEVVTNNPKGGFSVVTPTMSECYIKAGYAARGNAAGSAASRLLKNVKFSARLDYLREQQATLLATLNVADNLECCMVLTEIIRARHTDFLTMSADGEETLNTAGLKKVKTSCITLGKGKETSQKQFDEIELTDKISAIKCLANIMGFKKADDQKDKELDAFERFVDQVTHVPDDQRTPQTG